MVKLFEILKAVFLSILEAKEQRAKYMLKNNTYYYM